MNELEKRILVLEHSIEFLQRQILDLNSIISKVSEKAESAAAWNRRYG